MKRTTHREWERASIIVKYDDINAIFLRYISISNSFEGYLSEMWESLATYSQLLDARVEDGGEGDVIETRTRRHFNCTTLGGIKSIVSVEAYSFFGFICCHCLHCVDRRACILDHILHFIHCRNLNHIVGSMHIRNHVLRSFFKLIPNSNLQPSLILLRILILILIIWLACVL